MTDPAPFGRRAADWLASKLARPPRDAPPSTPAPERAEAVRPSAPTPVKRVRSALDAEAERLERLRQQAHADAVTGLPNRRHFIGRLGAALGQPGVPPAALLILRVSNLEASNRRVGHAAIDELLAALAEVVAAYPERVPGAFAGRLNGSDFALCLPVAGVAEETAHTLLGALRAAVGGHQAGFEMVVGAVDALQTQVAGEALAAADEALAQAESAGPFAVEVRSWAPEQPAPLGERAWRQRIEEALHEGRASLGAFPVRDAEGRLLHLESPLRVQFDAAGPFQVASRWLAMAARGRLLPVVDLAALDLALTAIANDGQPRCVHVAAASLDVAGFVGEVAQRLAEAGPAVRSLWIDVAEGPGLERVLPRLREASAAWRRHGVNLGLEHAGASMTLLPRLGPLGLGHLKIDARHLRGVAADGAVRDFAAGLAGLAHGLQWQLIAEGVDDADELAALWALGFDGATGPLIR